MAEFFALPIFIDAWALDCAHLSDAEDGRYFRLCRLMWAQPLCRIPNDDAWIARKLSRSVDDVQREIRPLIAEYCQNDGNWITQKRLTKEWLYIQKRVKARSVSAKARWAKEKTDANAMRERTTSHDVRNALSPTLSPTPQEEDMTTAPAKPSPTNGAQNVRQRKATESGTRLDAHWLPNAEDRAFAEQLGLNADVTGEEFRDYWIGIPGSRGRKLDWSATYRNRCREVAGRSGRSGAVNGRRAGEQGGGDGIVAAVSRVIARRGLA